MMKVKVLTLQLSSLFTILRFEAVCEGKALELKYESPSPVDSDKFRTNLLLNLPFPPSSDDDDDDDFLNKMSPALKIEETDGSMEEPTEIMERNHLVEMEAEKEDNPGEVSEPDSIEKDSEEAASENETEESDDTYQSDNSDYTYSNEGETSLEDELEKLEIIQSEEDELINEDEESGDGEDGVSEDLGANGSHVPLAVTPLGRQSFANGSQRLKAATYEG